MLFSLQKLNAFLRAKENQFAVLSQYTWEPCPIWAHVEAQNSNLEIMATVPGDRWNAKQTFSLKYEGVCKTEWPWTRDGKGSLYPRPCSSDTLWPEIMRVRKAAFSILHKKQASGWNQGFVKTSTTKQWIYGGKSTLFGSRIFIDILTNWTISWCDSPRATMCALRVLIPKPIP